MTANEGIQFNHSLHPELIIEKGDVKILVDVAMYSGRDLKDKELSTSQIRNIFGEVRVIDMNWDANPQDAYRRAVLLLPKLSYAAARESGKKAQGVKELKAILTPCLVKLQSADNDTKRKLYFDRFVDFFEAILAYHKAAGGS